MDSKTALLYQRRQELADLVLDSLADIDTHPDFFRLVEHSQAARDALRIETLIGILNRLIGPDPDGVYYLAAVVDIAPEPEPFHVTVGFCRTVKEPKGAEVRSL
jgi:hypothetical protein